MTRPWSVEHRLRRHLLVDSETGCWNWTGKRTQSGYGVMDALRNQGLGIAATTTHRLAAYVWLGLDLSSSLDACHRCDNKGCFNPDHLFLGTRKENMRDAVLKGRMDKKLTLSDAEEIRRRYRAGETQVELARVFGVSQPNVGSIVNGKIRVP